MATEGDGFGGTQGWVAPGGEADWCSSPVSAVLVHADPLTGCAETGRVVVNAQQEPARLKKELPTM